MPPPWLFISGDRSFDRRENPAMSPIEPPPFRPRLISRGDRDYEVVRTGHQRLLFRDLYVNLLNLPWWAILALGVAFYLISNIFFATIYYLLGSDVSNAHGYADMFFFSVQTMATIGYGHMIPITMTSNMLVAIEALWGLSFFAFVTGLVFSKFSRPTAHVLFSNVAVISDFNGAQHLKIRMANQRTNRIVDAHARLYLMRNTMTQEGYRMRRFYDLPLVRSDVPLLQLTWTLLHLVDENSPLYGLTQEQMAENGDEVIVALVGLDETLMQTIHARHSYISEEIIPDAFFVDVVSQKDGKVHIDYRLFHSTRPAGVPDKTPV
jgi:inward rectifier potassium channel